MLHLESTFKSWRNIQAPLLQCLLRFLNCQESEWKHLFSRSSKKRDRDRKQGFYLKKIFFHHFHAFLLYFYSHHSVTTCSEIFLNFVKKASLFKMVCSEELFQWQFFIFHSLIFCSIFSNYLITGQLLLSLNSLICLCEMQSYLRDRYSPRFTGTALCGCHPLRFFLRHNSILSNEYPEQNCPLHHTESSWSKIIWHSTFLHRKMSAHLIVLLKHINCDVISSEAGKQTTKSILFRLWNEYLNHLCID